MDFKNQILQLSEKIEKQRDSIGTEQATKNAFILPMLSILGYDIHDPFEVVPEMDCDMVRQKGEKIDYAILKNGEPVIVIECKHCKHKLSTHEIQLKKYFVATKARFGVLTNGIEYKFYTDLDRANIMDEKPFLAVDLLNISDSDIEQLKKFHKSHYNEKAIINTASELQIMTALREIITRDFYKPTAEFVRYFIREINGGKSTAKQVEQYRPLVKQSIGNYIYDMAKGALNEALKNEMQTEPISEEQEVCETATQEETEAYNIVKKILSKYTDREIQFRKFKAHCAVGWDFWTWVCRLSIKPRSKRIGFPKDNYKDNEWFQIESIEDIYKYEDRLKEAIEMIEQMIINRQKTK